MTHQLAKYCDSYLIAIPTLCPHLRYPGTVPEERLQCLFIFNRSFI